MTTPLPSGAQAARAITLALAEADVTPGEVGYVNAHATGTPLGDVAEAQALRLALGEQAARVPVSGTKGLHGHALGASGAIEAAITTLALARGWLPPTANLDEPDADCCLAHVPAAGQAATGDIALTNSFGFGGINASLVLRRWPAE
jgi:3-oxoacyl-[acyl-carrier-protein] synthase II